MSRVRSPAAHTGKQMAPTRWSVTYSELAEWEGLREARRLEVAWHLAGEPFTYFRCEVASLEALR